jgi:hypothetical protein
MNQESYRTMSNNPRRWLEQVLPKKTVQQAAKLMNEQCWCWGADIRYGDGNLLLTYGFRRDRTPAPTLGSNMYSVHPSPTSLIALWGWGLFYGDANLGGMFIGRNGFAPMITPTGTIPSPIFSSSDLPSLKVPATETEYQMAGHLTGSALRWIAHYEAWLLPIAGEAYRLSCLSEWRKRPVERYLSGWLWTKLADEIEDALLNSHALA